MTLAERFAPVFDEVGHDAVERERERRLPFAEVAALREAGFTRVTVPVEHGGDGAGHAELFELLAELARRDPNLAQLLRSHFSFVDRTVHAPGSAERRRRLDLVAAGRIVGNASHERGPATVGSLQTTLTRDGGGYRLNGRKYYSTGALYADLIVVGAEHDGSHVGVLVDAAAPGVDRLDDWTGFGQRLTGSGTTVFDDVPVPEHDVTLRGADAVSHGGAFVQLVLLAAAVGIARAVVDDAAAFVRARTRVYSHGSAARVQDDPVVQQVVGELSAKSFAADSALAAASGALARSSAALLGGEPEPEQRARVADAEVAVARAQLVILPAVLDAATTLFEVGGASALDAHRGLDRHWRNARTLASHNPARYKARALGDHLINGTPVVSWWSTGEA
ncbi:acyl-CoA dehydrogenase family protein [Herbiconiux sp. SYSU D00978]|uniref:acyl-CoA dehydrogenase family protein n=1 Tax=Herbiconiux sp. SYSU D00978 TaxID=2812562 RepID=UPI001A96993C|nr:acyl-CoA dehydrogenase family protein [Herbiconiux sp. SYSU D00978]